MHQEIQRIEGVNGREKILMTQDECGWYWWGHEYDKPENVVYESPYFPGQDEAEKHLEEVAEILKGYLPEPVFYIHDGQWWWQYHLRGATEPLLSAGPFSTEKEATENQGWLQDLVVAWGGPETEED